MPIGQSLLALEPSDNLIVGANCADKLALGCRRATLNFAPYRPMENVYDSNKGPSRQMRFAPLFQTRILKRANRFMPELGLGRCSVSSWR
jgi:hypothetical protein